MQTLLEILNKTTEYFTKCGVPDPRLDAQYILAKQLGLTRMELYLKFDRPMTEPELAALRPLVQRRGKREPLQHILGSTSFRGLEIKCDRRALIPRPETEVLVDMVLTAIKDVKCPLIADIGTGTGAIALAIASERPDAKVYASDKSQDALALAKENAQALGLEGRIQFLESDLLESYPVDLHFDLIVSNPPYIPAKICLSLQPEVKNFDPKMALDGGNDGLDLVWKLLKTSFLHLKIPGQIILEVGEGQGKMISEGLDPAWGLEFHTNGKDLAGVARFPHLFFKQSRG